MQMEYHEAMIESRLETASVIVNEITGLPVPKVEAFSKHSNPFDPILHYEHTSNRIRYQDNLPLDDVLSALPHELMHAVQYNVPGFGEYFGTHFEAYMTQGSQAIEEFRMLQLLVEGDANYVSHEAGKRYGLSIKNQIEHYVAHLIFDVFGDRTDIAPYCAGERIVRDMVKKEGRGFVNNFYYHPETISEYFNRDAFARVRKNSIRSFINY